MTHEDFAFHGFHPLECRNGRDRQPPPVSGREAGFKSIVLIALTIILFYPAMANYELLRAGNV